MLTPRENTTLFGHQNARDLFLKSFHSSHFPHAWIISGPFGIGKATFSFHMARYILSGRKDGQTLFSTTDSLYRRVLANSHGNLYVIGDEEEKEIGIDPIRELNRILSQTPAEEGWRVVIIDKADLLNRNAANALLKRLEEPSFKTVFFLTTAFSGRLLPTLRSRCQIIPLTPLKEDEIRQVLLSQDIAKPEDLSFCEGSPGRIIRAIEGEGLQLYTDLQMILKGGESVAFIHTYGGDDTSYGLIENFVRYFIHYHLIAKAQGTISCFAQDSLDEALKICEKIGELFDQCRQAQLDRKTTLSCVFACLGNRK